MAESRDSGKVSNPYQSLPDSAFWRSAIADRHFSEIASLWKPKFPIKKEHKIATFGSCFAQHIGRALKNRGFGWLETEPPPPSLSIDAARTFNYSVFTCRTANIYTTSLLAQWTRWALAEEPAPPEAWQSGGRFFDPFRPTIEPDGFESLEEMTALRAVTIEAFRKAVETADLFVFTLGLTESWWNKEGGYEYPVCPGTAAGRFEPDKHRFENLVFIKVFNFLREAMDMMRSVNPKIRFILTVSPVPLTATKSGGHVLVATMESKSILRAVAGQLSHQRPDTVYFPSYEIINSPVTRGLFFEPNMRTVSPMGVDFVMSHFFSGLENGPHPPNPRQETRPVGSPRVKRKDEEAQDVICEEELLDAFRANSALVN